MHTNIILDARISEIRQGGKEAHIANEKGGSIGLLSKLGTVIN